MPGLSANGAGGKQNDMKALRWLCVSLLAGCTAAPPPGPQACDVSKAAEIPITFERGFVSAPAMIEQQPVRLLIDTGSEVSLVTPSAMAVLHLDPDMHKRTTIQATGGAITTQNALLPSLSVGGMEMLDQTAAVGPLPARQSEVVNASGLLGADWLSDFDVELDLPHRRIALYRVTGCSGDYVPWQGQKTSVFAQVYRHGLVILPAELDGHPIAAMLDSGASHSILTEAAATRIGIGPSALALDSSGTSIGIDGARLTTHRHRFGRLQIGDASYANPLISVSTLHHPVADMLLGADWLRRNRVWISYATRRVAIQPSPPVP